MPVSSFLDAIGRVGKFGNRWDDDFYDRLNHRYTVILIVIFVVAVSTKQYVGDPIVCWCPGTFTGVMVDYTHQICWINNTYYLPNTRAPLMQHERRENVLIYYQWVPMILLLQAFMFLVPNIIWRLYSSKNGLDVNRLVMLVNAIENLNPEVRDHTVQFMVRHIDRSLQYQKYLKTGRCSQVLKRLMSYCCCIACGRGYGNYAVALYILIKMLYIANAIGQLWLLNGLLGTDYNLYGIKVMQAMWLGTDLGKLSIVFPRVTKCDFIVRQAGNLHQYTVDCTLPINLFTEKIYIFLWFWLVFVAAASCVGLMQWVSSLFIRSRVFYIKKYLKITETIRGNKVDKALLKRFVTSHLQQDGVFALHLLGKNTNDVIVLEVVTALWDYYKMHHTMSAETDTVGEIRENRLSKST